MKTFVCVLKSGGDYTPQHVKILRNMVERHLPSVERFVCLTDMRIKGVETLPLQLGLKGKYSMMEAFRITGHVVVTGIDTIFTRNADVLFDITEDPKENDFWMIKAFNPTRTYANGIMAWNGDWTRLMTKYDPQISLGYKLEQNYTIHKLQMENADIRIINEEVDGVYSYKHHCCNGGIPDDTRVILFHGYPRPHQATGAQIQALYK